MRHHSNSSLLAVLLLLTACAKGGSDDAPRSEVQVSIDMHMSGILGRLQFPEFPVTPGDTRTLSGRLEMRDDATYTLIDGTSDAATGTYALDNTGRFTLRIPSSTTTTVLQGGYGLGTDSRHWFATDRFGEAIGLLIGTRVVNGEPDMSEIAGDWHVFSMHTIYADDNALQDPDEIGRSFGGSITLNEDGSFAGQGSESTNPAASLPITGDQGAFQAFRNGEFEIGIDYGDDRRNFLAGGNGDAIFGADTSENDGAAGLLIMMRKRATSASASRLAGTYVMGMWTLFLRTTASGFDSAIATLELTRDGSFRIEARNNQGEDFSYRGFFEFEDDGSLTFDVDGTDETWSGAFDQDYETVVLVDHEKERRSNGQIELNFGIAVREQPDSDE